MRLFVRWAPGQDPDEIPTVIWWEDGTMGTLEEYASHYSDHQVFTPDRGSGARLMLYTDALADVHFNERIAQWVYTTPSKERILLELTDPEATDDQINEAIAGQVVIPNPQATKRRARRGQHAKGASG